MMQIKFQVPALRSFSLVSLRAGYTELLWGLLTLGSRSLCFMRRLDFKWIEIAIGVQTFSASVPETFPQT